VAEEALVPLSVAASVTAVPVGTLMLDPLCPPPDSEVVNDVGCVVTPAVTVSTSPAAPQVLDEDWLVESPE
jgi:hypothetical protein